uniref:Uncharacterized protein n=1 Tax=Phaseolus vulgaris TaxID=3885 RepID=V7BYX0_PHAVU|nr:hypothetical protein PHAVU_005G101800g [Phaseolus vulgaris]ESW21821.1 hypothetical protein PHAVU_005G101800g [Phaseolus vulgaris]
MDSSATIGETKKIAARSSIVESFRGCDLSGIRIDKDELKKQFTIPQYLRPAAGRLHQPRRRRLPPLRSGGRHDMVVFINSPNGGCHGPLSRRDSSNL